MGEGGVGGGGMEVDWSQTHYMHIRILNKLLNRKVSLDPTVTYLEHKQPY